jgi:nucleotide-binding universal stress UspA family protein
MEQINAHQYRLEQESGAEVTLTAAAADWYDNIYQPVARLIREKGILRDFPGRTTADLYLWIAKHREHLGRVLGWEVAPGEAATSLVEVASQQPDRVAARVSGKLRDALTPGALDTGPETGTWRRARVVEREEAGTEGPKSEESPSQLFADILVPLSGEEIGWQALEQAILVAQREQARLLGLHVVPSDRHALKIEIEIMQARFRHRCADAGVPGHLVIDTGDVVSIICDRARWVDLVVVNLAHPPPPPLLGGAGGTSFLERLKPGFRTLIRRCPRPLLVVPGQPTALQRALLAYDASSKAEEALFVATYLAGQWQIPLTVVTVLESHTSAETLEQARRYVEGNGVQATFELLEGPVVETILALAREKAAELILIGGYGIEPVREVVVGSTVSQLLREAPLPLLVSR